MTKICYGFVLGMAWLPLSCLASGPVDDASDCGTGSYEEPLVSDTGSVGVIKNLAEDPTSIRAVAGRLLASALSGISNPGDTACNAPCPEGKKNTEIVYRVAPTAFLANELQRAECRKFEAETASQPLTFKQHDFRSVDELNEWITAFSQGRGEDGRRLYELCSSNCSPRYTFLIAEHNSRYAVKAEVLCGLARDKSNDIYKVSTALRRSCVVN
jgi:hypothetical protein